jgi:hypothetical protein
VAGILPASAVLRRVLGLAGAVTPIGDPPTVNGIGSGLHLGPQEPGKLAGDGHHRHAGDVLAAFQYARPNTSPTTQAAHFISVVRQNGFRPGDVAILDMEDVKASKGMSASDLRAWVKHWVADVRQALDLREVVFYTGIPYWTGRMGDPPRLPTGCIGMVARYHKRGPYVRPLRRPAAWPDPPAIWQFTDGKHGRVRNIPGIGKVDCSEMTETAFNAVFGREEDDFMALFNNVNEFKAAVRAVVQDEVKEEIGKIYKALARGEINGHIDETSTHFQDSNRHLAKLLKQIADRLPASTPTP